MNPHFLFNALNTRYGTIDRRSRLGDPEAFCATAHRERREAWCGAKQGAGVVRVVVEITAGGWRILVRDTEPGFSARGDSLPSGSGAGLENLRERLQLCHSRRAI